MLAERSPALFLEPRPASPCPGVSRRIRVGGRIMLFPLGRAEVEGWPLALDGGRFAERDGDGDDLDELTPFVWMPGGTGRFALVGMTGGGTAVTETGAIAPASVVPPSGPAQRARSSGSGARVAAAATICG
jgi:hypothetical protein